MGLGTYSHVWSTSNLHRLGNGVDQPSRDPKVTELEFTFPVDQDVGWLDICKGDWAIRPAVQQKNWLLKNIYSWDSKLES